MQDKHQQEKDWQEVESIFHAALALKEDQRSTYLANACAGKDLLLSEVQSLLAAFANQNLLDHDAFSMGLEVLHTSNNKPLAGKSIGAYKVLNTLGRGGMGEVYLADDTRLVRKVALKFLTGELVGGDDLAKRQLMKEAQAVAKLDHPNICTVYGFEESDGHSFIVMQYIEGETLANLVRSHRLEAGRALALAQQIVSALAEAHARGIVHRDIKPSNIMVTRSHQAKVLDFGLAKFLWPEREANGDNRESRGAGSSAELIAGTVAYMSPEQLRGEKLDGRSDIFSFGVLLYELIAGKNPFVCESDAETIAAILTRRPPPIGKLAQDIPHEITRVTSRCLEKNRDLRYQSADELLLHLNRIQKRGTRWYHTRLLRRATAFILALVIVIGLAWLFLSLRPNKVQALAIMPMVNETSEPGVESLSDGLTEGLIAKLSRFSGLRVKPLTTVTGFRNWQLDAQQVGKDLKVDAIVIGHVVDQGGRQSLEARLLSTTDGRELWTGRYDFSLTGLSFLERDISEKIAVGLRVQSNGDSANTQAAKRWSPDPEAQRNYLYGRSFMQKRDASNIKTAISHFEKAVELDPAYALAHASLAECYLSLPSPAYGSLKTKDVMYMARSEAMKALEIDEESSEAHTVLGVIQLKYGWKWQEAEKEFQRAILLNPDYSTAHFWYSQLLTVLGRMTEAIAESEKARDLDPSSPINNMNVGRAYYFDRQYQRAIDHLNGILEKNPDDPRALYVLGYVYLQVGNLDKALNIFQSIYNRDKMVGAAPLGLTYGRMGKTEDALRILKELDTLSSEKNVHPHERAMIYMGLNDRDNAFKWFEQSKAERFASIPYLNTEPVYDSLRSDPRFAEFVRSFEL